MRVVRYADRPDLLARRYEELTKATFPEYMNHNEPGSDWGRLYTDFPEFQVALVDGDELLAEAHAISLPWDGTLDDLPSGWDEGFTRGMTSSDLPHTALMAIAISVAPSRQGGRLSSRMIETFTDRARDAGLSNGVIAPVRPTLKERYPLVPIERYAEWRHGDGSHFDPWLRIHELVGGEIIALAPASMTIRGSPVEWEEWTGMPFPDDGTYVIPGGLAPVVFEDGVGTHVEPNIWVLHRV